MENFETNLWLSSPISEFPSVDDEPVKITISSSLDDLVYNFMKSKNKDSHVFGLSIKKRGDTEHLIAYDHVDMNELELFSKSILAHVELVKSKYKKMIDYQIEKGYSV